MEEMDALGGMSQETIMALMAAYIGFATIVSVLFVVCMWRIFEKAGEPGWAAIIPIYSFIVLLKIVDKPGWWLLLVLIPLVNIYVLFVVMHSLSKSFGQGIGFTFGLIFLSFICYPMLAFGDYRYDKSLLSEE